MTNTLTEPVFLRSSRVFLPRDLPPRPFHVSAGGGACLQTITFLKFPGPGTGVDWIQVVFQPSRWGDERFAVNRWLKKGPQ